MTKTEEKKEVKRELAAADILKADHPVNKHFTKWLQGKEATKRQARKFLQAFPQYRG
jgi:hypothetical protein